MTTIPLNLIVCLGFGLVLAASARTQLLSGASPWRRYRSVTLPQMREVISVTVMLSAIWTFNSFHMVFILTGGGPAMRTHILPTLAYEYGITQSQLGLGSAVLVSVVPVFLVLIVVLTRRMLQSNRR